MILEIWNCPQLSSNKHIFLVFILCLVICMYTYRIHFLVCYLVESFGFFYNSIYCEYICVKCFFIVVVVATCWILSYIAATWFCCCMYSYFFLFELILMCSWCLQIKVLKAERINVNVLGLMNHLQATI